MSVVKLTSKDHLEVKLVTITEYAVKDSIEKNDSNKSCMSHEGLSLVSLTLNLTLKPIWVQPAKAKLAANPAS